MNDIVEIIDKSALFEKIKTEDIELMLNCLNYSIKTYEKGSIIFLSGDKVRSIGMVLEGTVQVIKEDYLGNSTIISEISKTDIFAEAFVLAGIDKMPISVITKSKSKIVFLDYKKIITTCNNSCKFHSRLIENMLSLVSQKNILLNGRIDVLSKRILREKILAFLSQYYDEKNPYFDIKMKRQEMADYLSVDRSAMSRELSKMKKEGLIDYEASKFKNLSR